jgi:hypothetical protein
LLFGSSPLTCVAWEALPVAYATASIALGIMWPHKPHHYVKVGIPSGGGGGLKCTAPANLRLSSRRGSSLPSSGVWLGVTGQFVPYMPVGFTFNFKSRKSKKKKILEYDHRRWNRCIISKCREQIITWCGVVPQKNWNVSYGGYLGHKCDCFSVIGCGQKCLTACAQQQPPFNRQTLYLWTES